MADSPAPILRLLDLHAQLDALLLAHQTAVLERDLPRATETFEAYAATLARHIADEEAHVLPIYAERVPIREGGKTAFFQFEHTKLRATLGVLREMLAGVSEDFPVAAALALLDRETALKDLLAHHDAREREFLYPGLAAVLSEMEQRAVLGRLSLPPEA